jgi:hypothetical protein
MERLENYLEEFLCELKEEFPNQVGKLERYRTICKATMKLKPDIVIDKIRKNFSIYKKEIYDENEDELMSNDFQHIVDDNLIRVNREEMELLREFWKKDMSQEQKDMIFKYLKVLVWCVDNIV